MGRWRLERQLGWRREQQCGCRRAKRHRHREQRRAAGWSGTHPTQHAPEDAAETDELIAMALYDDVDEEDFDDGHDDLMRASSAPRRRRIAT